MYNLGIKYLDDSLIPCKVVVLKTKCRKAPGATNCNTCKSEPLLVLEAVIRIRSNYGTKWLDPFFGNLKG